MEATLVLVSDAAPCLVAILAPEGISPQEVCARLLGRGLPLNTVPLRVDEIFSNFRNPRLLSKSIYCSGLL